MAKDKKVKKTRKNKNSEVYVTTFGRYGTLSRAMAEAEQMVRHDVFRYRTALFPNPVAFRVEAQVTKAEAVEQDGAHPLYKYSITITIDLKGAPADRLSWIRAMEDRMRVVR